ncbi:2Fe-2S iron-sulfur cluster-binding protein [Streptomyces sp. TRM70350]|uniref:2Fe-2S iron-sulfur cluster-binding protein n=1 Tax=Streptomyces sp. TRM70350 TaxID=2856165 RepID=UPI001C45D214|nr:2Fe-2S iron-sulfur cluster-binding protein [Streptomyces sp. TRM70350]MBV7698940.1 (2Fe-2S)-binding protein [Streptomyces sp. TRM70350]
MTDDQHGEGTPQGGGRWDPLPQGDYDDGATAFVKLPEGGIDALLASADSPLAAPGHGYVPPPITVTPAAGTDPAATGTWGAPSEGAQWPDPNAMPQGGGQEQFAYNPGGTGQWHFEEATQPEAAQAAPGHDVTGQWSIPVANGDLPDESGEFTTSALVEQWGGTPPATLPGGAPAPWATEAAGQPWGHADGPQSYPDAPVGHPAEGAPAVREGTEGAQEAPGAHEGVEAAEGPAETPEAGPGAPGAAEAAVSPSEGPAERPAEGAAPSGDAESRPEPADAQPGEPDAPAEPSVTPPHEEHPLASYVLRVNGTDRPVTDAWIGESLLYVLRERLGLAGAKDGCSQGECGACNVQVDGRLVASCLVPAVTAAGSEVRTVEGLAVDGRPSDVQRALAKCGAVQCGFCVPGMAMTVHDLLEGNPAPTELETRQALCGNLCRCSGYRAVLEAVKDVVAERGAHAAAEAPEQDADQPRIPHQAGPGAGGVNPAAFESPGTPPGPHDQPYGHGQGQDGGQA